MIKQFDTVFYIGSFWLTYPGKSRSGWVDTLSKGMVELGQNREEKLEIKGIAVYHLNFEWKEEKLNVTVKMKELFITTPGKRE